MPTPFDHPACSAAPHATGVAEERHVEATRDLACETLYRCLAAALSIPDAAARSIFRDASSLVASASASDYLRERFADIAIPLGFGELLNRQLNAELLWREMPDGTDMAMTEYVRVFGFAGSRECSPYETEYHPNEEVFFRSQQMADIAGFYRAFGLNVSPVRHERTDHIALELEFAAFLLMKKRLALQEATDAAALQVIQSARRSFLNDHLCWWAPSFTVALRRKAPTGFYAAVADLLSALLPIERYRLGIAPPRLPLEAHADDMAASTSGCEGCALARG